MVVAFGALAEAQGAAGGGFPVRDPEAAAVPGVTPGLRHPERRHAERDPVAAGLAAGAP